MKRIIDKLAIIMMVFTLSGLLYSYEDYYEKVYIVKISKNELYNFVCPLQFILEYILHLFSIFVLWPTYILLDGEVILYIPIVLDILIWPKER